MKAEELMIGDWVDFYHPYEPEKKIVTRHRVTGTFECGLVEISNHPNPVHADHIEPVKITPEVLEKNGFEMVLDKDKLPTYRIKWTRNPNLYFTVFTGVDGYWNPVGYGVAIAGVNGVIDYVHQLQHALKLCGINKEIVL